MKILAEPFPNDLLEFFLMEVHVESDRDQYFIKGARKKIED